MLSIHATLDIGLLDLALESSVNVNGLLTNELGLTYMKKAGSDPCWSVSQIQSIAYFRGIHCCSSCYVFSPNLLNVELLVGLTKVTKI